LVLYSIHDLWRGMRAETGGSRDIGGLLMLDADEGREV
jgi:hypothetical protein